MSRTLTENNPSELAKFSVGVGSRARFLQEGPWEQQVPRGQKADSEERASGASCSSVFPPGAVHFRGDLQENLFAATRNHEGVIHSIGTDCSHQRYQYQPWPGQWHLSGEDRGAVVEGGWVPEGLVHTGEPSSPGEMSHPFPAPGLSLPPSLTHFQGEGCPSCNQQHRGCAAPWAVLGPGLGRVGRDKQGTCSVRRLWKERKCSTGLDPEGHRLWAGAPTLLKAKPGV